MAGFNNITDIFRKKFGSKRQTSNGVNSSWFKAKDIGIATAHYPASWQGWFVFLCGAVLLVFIFVKSDAFSYSASDTLLNAASPSIAVLLFTDLITRRRCEKTHTSVIARRR